MSKNSKPPRPRQITQTVRAGLECDDATGCVVPPTHLSSAFAFRAFGQKRTYDYTRSGNPAPDRFGATLAKLDMRSRPGGTASGSAARGGSRRGMGEEVCERAERRGGRRRRSERREAA